MYVRGCSLGDKYKHLQGLVRKAHSFRDGMDSTHKKYVESQKTRY